MTNPIEHIAVTGNKYINDFKIDILTPVTLLIGKEHLFKEILFNQLYHGTRAVVGINSLLDYMSEVRDYIIVLYKNKYSIEMINSYFYEILKETNFSLNITSVYTDSIKS